jgi:predicted nucleic acid-binding protein
MKKYRIYLDNCCYHRPFDGQEQRSIFDETMAKLYIQELVKYDCLTLVYSYILLDEVEANKAQTNKASILKFIDDNASVYVGAEYADTSTQIANEIKKTGIKNFDALHIACAIIAKCDYFITTDKRLLQYKTDKINIINPIDYVKILEDGNNV